MKRTSMGTALLATLAIGCSDSTGPATTADLVGTWVASAFVFTNSANAAETVDVIQLGMAYSVTFTETTASGTISIPGQDPVSFTGAYTLNATQLTFVDPADGNETVTVALDGNVLTINGADTYDFNDDGQEQPATYVITLGKQ